MVGIFFLIRRVFLFRVELFGVRVSFSYVDFNRVGRGRFFVILVLWIVRVFRFWCLGFFCFSIGVGV